MTKEIDALRQEVAKLKGLIGSHIGNANAHPIVQNTKSSAGFIDVDTFRFARNNPKWIPETTDLSTLDSGLYTSGASQNLVNGPEKANGASYISVFNQENSENSTNKLIIVYDITTRNVFRGWKSSKSGGGIAWEDDGERHILGEKFSGGTSYYSVTVSNNSKQVQLVVSVDINAATDSTTTLTTEIPTDLKPPYDIYGGGLGIASGSTTRKSASFAITSTGAIKIFNTSDSQLTHFSGSLVYTIESQGNQIK